MIWLSDIQIYELQWWLIKSHCGTATFYFLLRYTEKYILTIFVESLCLIVIKSALSCITSWVRFWSSWTLRKERFYGHWSIPLYVCGEVHSLACDWLLAQEWTYLCVCVCVCVCVYILASFSNGTGSIVSYSLVHCVETHFGWLGSLVHRSGQGCLGSGGSLSVLSDMDSVKLAFISCIPWASGSHSLGSNPLQRG